MEVLIALAATLPRQIEMTHDVHTFTSGWNDLLAQLGAPDAASPTTCIRRSIRISTRA